MARYIDVDKLLIKIKNRHKVRYFTPTKEDMQLIDIFEIINTQPTANVLHIDDVFRLIAGHSDYHGDDILAALMCVTEGKEVKTIRPLEDVVKVVRCKSCIKRDTDDCWIAFYGEDGELFCDTLDNDYCGRGERRDT